jgi:hypothetical protein
LVAVEGLDPREKPDQLELAVLLAKRDLLALKAQPVELAKWEQMDKHYLHRRTGLFIHTPMLDKASH